MVEIRPLGFVTTVFFFLISEGDLPKAKYPDNPELGEISFLLALYIEKYLFFVTTVVKMSLQSGLTTFVLFVEKIVFLLWKHNLI